MKPVCASFSFGGLFLALLWSGTAAVGQDAEKPRKVVKSDEEWAKVLTREQFLVTRRKLTEQAFSGKYAHSKAKGIYTCVCCGEELFSSKTKFESGTGWPSFYSPVSAKSIARAPDYEGAEARVEVTCRVCGAHLGHVFDDGPAPTGLRYCINSASLKLVAPEKSQTAAKPTAKKTKKGPVAKKTGKSTAKHAKAAPSETNSAEAKPQPDEEKEAKQDAPANSKPANPPPAKDDSP